MQNTQADQIDFLRQQIYCLEGVVSPRVVSSRQGIGSGEEQQNASGNAPKQGFASGCSSGCPPLDALLPAKGFRPGTLVEWLAYDEAHREDGVSLSPGDPGNVSTGSGAATLAFLAAGEALRRSEARASPGAVVVLDPWGEFYPPAAVRWGLDPARLIVVHPGNRADYQWAFDQALRCSCVAAAIAWPDAVRRQQPQQGSSSRKGAGVNGHTFRRWQLAAEGGGGLGLMIRPLCARHEPSWADVRMLVEPLPAAAPHGAARRLRVTLLRCRGGMQERVVELEIPT